MKKNIDYNDQKSISVCIPCYEMHGSGGKYLIELLDSLQKQTFKNFEIIVSDQSKTNEIQKIVENYKSFNPIIYKKSSGNSASSNMNNAMKFAKCSIIKPMFQDDKAYSKTLLERITQSEFYWGAVGTFHIDEKSRDIGRIISPIRSVLQPFGINKIGNPSVIFFKNKNTLKFNEDLTNLMDCEFYQKLYAHYGEPELIKEPLVAVRLWKGSISSNINTTFTNILELSKICFKQPYRYNVKLSANGILPYFDLSKCSKVNINIDKIAPKKKWNNYYFQIEPHEINKKVYDIIKKQKKYKKIFAWDKHILDSCSNSELFLYGTTWVKNTNFITEAKPLSVTMLSTTKNKTSGHKFRQKVVETLRNIKTKYPIYIHVSPPFLKNKSDFLEKGKYSIVVENTYEKNWFTEKIIDCFRLGIVPIYWGCPNINEFFDVDGIIPFNDLTELKEILEINLTAKDFLNRKKAIKTNKDIAEKYCNFNKRVSEIIKSDQV